MPRHCTIPEIFNLRDWFEKNFKGCCRVHDINYSPTTTMSRKQADRLLYECMMRSVRDKGFISKWFLYKPLVVSTYLFLRGFGWMHYKRD